MLFLYVEIFTSDGKIVRRVVRLRSRDRVGSSLGEVKHNKDQDCSEMFGEALLATLWNCMLHVLTVVPSRL